MQPSLVSPLPHHYCYSLDPTPRRLYSTKTSYEDVRSHDIDDILIQREEELKRRRELLDEVTVTDWDRRRVHRRSRGYTEVGQEEELGYDPPPRGTEESKDAVVRDVREDDVRKEDVREGDVRKEDVREGDLRKEDVREGDVREDDVRKEDVREGDVRDDDVRVEDVRDDGACSACRSNDEVDDKASFGCPVRLEVRALSDK